MLITNSLTTDLISVFVAGLVILIAYSKWSYTYWQRKGVQTLPPSFPLGNAGPMFRKELSFGEMFEEQYNYFKRQGLRFAGSYFAAKKFFIAIDPDLIKHIMQVDFQHFVNHGGYINEKIDPLSGHLFSLEDAKWKRLREKLTPTFTSGKMKMMFPTLVACGVELDKVVEKQANENQHWNIKETLARFSTDIIASCAFGIDSNCLHDADSEFRKYGKMIFDVDTIELLKLFMQFAFSNDFLGKIKFKATKQPVEDFILDLVNKTVKYREQNNIFRKDFMHLLIQLKNMGKVTDDEKISDGKIGEVGLTMNEVAAQAFVFFAAGFETSSTTMTFALYELALNQDVQDKLREEIRTTLKKYNNEITYEGVMEMKYLDRVICETLRKYPPVPTLTRNCNKEYKVPNSDVVIEKDIFVAIPASGIHHDHEYYPNPEKFDPDRFTDENKAKRPPFTWLPFGEGPRICIGLRFGVMQAKIGIITTIRNYRLTISNKMTVPIKINKLSFITSSQDDIYLNVEKCA